MVRLGLAVMGWYGDVGHGKLCSGGRGEARWVTARSVGAVTVRSGLFGYAWLGLVRRSRAVGYGTFR
jgi:hypothetical protein